MSDYDDYRKAEEDQARELDDLAKIREAGEWERRLKELVARSEKTRKTVLFYRSRLIKNAQKLRPDWTEAQATLWVDTHLGLEPAHQIELFVRLVVATLAWVDWFNHRRLFGPIGFMPPAEYEARYYEQVAVA